MKKKVIKFWPLFSIHQIYCESNHQQSQLFIDKVVAPVWSQEVGEVRGKQKVRCACISACCWKKAHNGVTEQKEATDKDCLLLVLAGGRRACSGKTDPRGSLKRWNMERDQGICLNHVHKPPGSSKDARTFSSIQL